MKTLYIDTHANDLIIILFDDDKIIKEEMVINERNNSTLLMPSIKKVCDDNTYDQIIVVNGPGSFTGVRLGVTVAKTLAYTLNKPIKTLTFFDVMKASHGGNIQAFSDNNGFFVKENDKMFYLSKKDYMEYKNEHEVNEDIIIDYSKVINYSESIDYTLSHIVNPIYVKLIGVENDKKN